VPAAHAAFQRAVVTGGAGFLGAAVCRRLLADGTSVVCIDNFLTSSPAAVSDLAHHPRFALHRADVADAIGIGGDVDLVLHLASPASPADYHRHPLATLAAGSDGTRSALELASRAGARFVLASTSEVYGDPACSPQPEDYWGNVNPVGPRSCYDEAKRFAEAITTAYRRERQVDTAIVRIFNTYGPGMRPDDGRMVPAFACQALQGQPLTVAGDGSQTRSLCHVDDTVRGILLLAASGAPGPVNIGNPDEATVLEFAKRIIELAGSNSPISHIPRPEDDPMTRKPDIGLARRLLGFEPRIGWRDGLRETLDWFASVLPGTAGSSAEGGGATGPLGPGQAPGPA
jgi:dTDP-glucose 4,6-dehydratase